MQRHVARSAIVRYGIAVLCVTVAVILALWLRPVTLVGGQLSLVAILITGWVCGLRPALVAWVLATLAFAYYFAPPLYAFRVDPPERPGFIIFTLLGLFMATVSAARRKAQGLLESARAQLETRVRERTADLERSNERLRESEEQWRAVFENNPTMYFMVDAAGTVVSVNPFGAEELGYTVDELVGQSVLKVFYEPDRQAVQAHVALCLQHPIDKPFRRTSPSACSSSAARSAGSSARCARTVRCCGCARRPRRCAGRAVSPSSWSPPRTSPSTRKRRRSARSVGG